MGVKSVPRRVYVEQIEMIREGLLIGLCCYGEVERIINQCQLLEVSGNKVPEDYLPMHPTGDVLTVGRFADALRMLDQIGGEP